MFLSFASLTVIIFMVPAVVFAQLVYSGLWPLLTPSERLKCMVKGNFEGTGKQQKRSEARHTLRASLAMMTPESPTRKSIAGLAGLDSRTLQPTSSPSKDQLSEAKQTLRAKLALIEPGSPKYDERRRSISSASEGPQKDRLSAGDLTQLNEAAKALVEWNHERDRAVSYPSSADRAFSSSREQDVVVSSGCCGAELCGWQRCSRGCTNTPFRTWGHLTHYRAFLNNVRARWQSFTAVLNPNPKVSKEKLLRKPGRQSLISRVCGIVCCILGIIPRTLSRTVSALMFYTLSLDQSCCRSFSGRLCFFLFAVILTPFYIGINIIAFTFWFDLIPIEYDTKSARKISKLIRFGCGLIGFSLMTVLIPEYSTTRVRDSLDCVLSTCKKEGWKREATKMDCKAAESVGILQPTLWSDLVDIFNAALAFVVLALVSQWKDAMQGKKQIGRELRKRVDDAIGQELHLKGPLKGSPKGKANYAKLVSTDGTGPDPRPSDWTCHQDMCCGSIWWRCAAWWCCYYAIDEKKEGGNREQAFLKL